MLKQIFLLLLIISIPIIGHAAIYRYLDSQGNYIYSDQPRSNATQIHLQKGQSMSWRPVDAKSLPQKPSAPLKPIQPKLTIVSPTEDQYIRTEEGEAKGALNVTANLTVDFKAGQVIQAYLDGKPYGKPQTTLTFKLYGLFRGTHTLQLRLLDQASGKKITSSKVVKFYMHRNIARPSPINPKNPDNPENQ
jgi:hypothetical protein